MRLLIMTLLALGLAHPAFGAQPPVIEAVNLEDETLTIEFDQPMQTWDGYSMQHNIKISPEINCSFGWDDETQLVCDTYREEKHFKPATYYQVQIGEGFRSQEGGIFAPKILKINSPGPRIEVNIVEWKNRQPQITVTTDLPASKKDIESHLLLKLNGKPVMFSLGDALKSENISQQPRYQLQYAAIVEEDAKLALSVKPGLISSAGIVPGDQNGEVLLAKVNETFKIKSLSCRYLQRYSEIKWAEIKTGAMQCDPEVPLTVIFSNALSQDSFARMAASMPKGFRFEKPEQQIQSQYYFYFDSKNPTSMPGTVYTIKSENAKSQFLLKLPDDATSIDGQKLQALPEILLDIGDYMTRFTVTSVVNTLLPGQAVKAKLEVLNSGLDATKTGQLQIDRGSTEKYHSLPIAGRKNIVQSVDFPEVKKSIEKNGGLSLFGSEEISGINLGVAYVPFNVLSHQSRDKVMVWATQWQSGQPVANARVEILRMDYFRKLHTSISGRTDENGVAMIDFSGDKAEYGDLMTLVRVSSEGKTVVTPSLLNSSSSMNFEDAWSYWQYQRNAMPEALSFGVTELPLYRPGENVKYRVWFRERSGNHLQMPGDKKDARLQLYDADHNNVLQSWDAKLDANTSVASSLILSRLLPDGMYCIGENNNRQNGACFQVARFESQPLWATLSADRKVALLGGSIRFDMESGYFSGGPATKIDLAFQGSNWPMRVEEVYPEFGDFSFINPFADGNPAQADDPLEGTVKPDKTDANGKAGFVLALDKPLVGENKKPIAFATLKFSAEVKIPGKASASSSSVVVNYAQYPRFVGLKTKEWWLPKDRDPGLEAVVISYDGKTIANEPVQVKIFQLGKEKQETEVGKCDLVSGKSLPCDFRATVSGRYVFRAQAKEAAGTELFRYIGESYRTGNTDKKPDATLKLLKATDGTSAVRVSLEQPFESATVLFTLEYDHIVRYWVQRVDDKYSEFDIPVQQAWAPGLSIRAVIRPANNASAQAGKDIETVDALLKIEIPRIQHDSLQVTSSRTEYKPGEQIELSISNPSAATAFATLSVIDDSVYQQGSAVRNSQDPENSDWLGKLKKWQPSSWYGVEAWKGGVNIFYDKNNPSPIKPYMDVPQPVTIVTREDIQATGLNNVYDILNNIKASDGSGLSAVATSPRGNDSFERVQVTGSRIKQVNREMAQPVQVVTREGCDSCEMVTVTGAKIDKADTAPAAIGRVNENPGKPKPRMRSQFQDAAYWNPDIVLAPGETRKITFKLPDNLTQWRVLLWANDSSDGFSLIQTTFNTTLPIEVRTGLPSQLFVGDKSRAQISARNQGKQPVSIALSTSISGAGVSLDKDIKGQVAAYESLDQPLDFSPTQEGSLDIAAIADSSKGSDGLSSGTFVQSRIGHEQITQSGWLDETMLNLTIPKLPGTAVDGKMDLQVSRGFNQWTQGWIKDLQDYPHRCWEQTLSRAVGAAYSQKHDEKSAWADRKETIIDALQVSKSFIDNEGYYQYFQPTSISWMHEPNIGLSAYTLKSFVYLKSLGYSVEEEDISSLEKLLADDVNDVINWLPGKEPLTPWENLAAAAGALENPQNVDANALEVIWGQWEKLSWFARSELLLAMSRQPDLKEQTRQGVERLLAAGSKHGLRQVINDDRDFSPYMGSNLRDQCAVVGALSRLDISVENKPTRERLLRGIYDIYAGGTPALDTQSSAQCLMALHEVTKKSDAVNAVIPLKIGFDNKSEAFAVAPSDQEFHWQAPLVTTNKTLQIASENNAGGSLNYNATIDYQFDLQQSVAKGTGIHVKRSYDVLQGDKWVPVKNGMVKEGAWIRVRLLVDAPRERYFVAVSDFAPGGFVTRDITLSSVGGANAEKIGGNSSYYFDSRQTGSSIVRIYAEYLPAGHHQIYYYAQAVHPGDYFAPPAIAELMYGRASRANTSADRVTVQAAGKAKDIKN